MAFATDNVHTALNPMSGINSIPVPNAIKLVYQPHPDGCGIASAAMIAGISYREAWERLAPPPSNMEHAAAYNARELKLLNEIGWWASAQLVLKTVVSLEDMDCIIDSEGRFKDAVDKSQRARIVLAFSDGAKPDHSVVWDRDHGDVVFDPSRGVIPMLELFNDAELQTYSGTLGMTAFCYQPGQPIQTLIKTEEGVVVPGEPPV
jgi:hypothetical protein